MEPVLRWLAEIVAAVIQPFRYFSRPTYPASSDITAEKGSEGVVEGTQAVVSATEDAVARPTTVKSFTASVTADPVREIDGSHRVTANQSPDFSHAAADITRASGDARALGAAIENACLVAHARQLITHSEFAEGYNLIKGMQGDEFLTALRMLAGRASDCAAKLWVRPLAPRQPSSWSPRLTKVPLELKIMTLCRGKVLGSAD